MARPEAHHPEGIEPSIWHHHLIRHPETGLDYLQTYIRLPRGYVSLQTRYRHLARHPISHITTIDAVITHQRPQQVHLYPHGTHFVTENRPQSIDITHYHSTCPYFWSKTSNCWQESAEHVINGLYRENLHIIFPSLHLLHQATRTEADYSEPYLNLIFERLQNTWQAIKHHQDFAPIFSQDIRAIPFRY
jgi:hypothetical protein